MKDFEEFETATKLLQDSKRTLFDGLLENNPIMHHYISSDNSFVPSSPFANGIVNVQSAKGERTFGAFNSKQYLNHCIAYEACKLIRSVVKQN
jgi:hypothetical protein